MSVDPSVHNIALLGAANSLHMTGAQRSLNAGIGTLCIAAGILATGSLGDRLGRKKVMLGGLALVIVAGIVTSLAPNPDVYTLGRALSGVAFAASFALSFALLRQVAPAPAELSKTVSRYLAMQTTAVVVLALLGGYLAGRGWRIAYLLGPALAAIALVPCIRSAPEARAPENVPFDYAGNGLIAIGLISTLSGVSNAAAAGWGSSAVLVPLGCGLLALAVFGFYEYRNPHPAFPIRLFADGELLAASVSGIGFNFANAVVVLQLSFLWQYVYRYAPIQVSLGQLPLIVASIFGAAWAGKLLARGVTARVLLPAGLLAMGVSVATMAFAAKTTPYWTFLLPLVVSGLALMLVQTPVANIFLAKSPPPLVGAVGSSRTAFGQLGFALGLAISSSILYGLFGSRFRRLLDNVGATQTQRTQAYGVIQTFTQTGTTQGYDAALAQKVIGAASATYLSAYQITLLACAAVITALAAAVFLILRRAR